MTQQGLRHSSFRAIGGTTGTYNGDAMAAMRTELEAAQLAVPDTFNGRMGAWLRLRLDTSDGNLPGLMASSGSLQLRRGVHLGSLLNAMIRKGDASGLAIGAAGVLSDMCMVAGPWGLDRVKANRNRWHERFKAMKAAEAADRSERARHAAQARWAKRKSRLTGAARTTGVASAAPVSFSLALLGWVSRLKIIVARKADRIPMAEIDERPPEVLRAAWRRLPWRARLILV